MCSRPIFLFKHVSWHPTVTCVYRTPLSWWTQGACSTLRSLQQGLWQSTKPSADEDCVHMAVSRDLKSLTLVIVSCAHMYLILIEYIGCVNLLLIDSSSWTTITCTWILIIDALCVSLFICSHKDNIESVSVWKDVLSLHRQRHSEAPSRHGYVIACKFCPYTSDCRYKKETKSVVLHAREHKEVSDAYSTGKVIAVCVCWKYFSFVCKHLYLYLCVY